MSLILIHNENIVDEDYRLIYEFNGTVGGVESKTLRIENTDTDIEHRHIVVYGVDSRNVKYFIGESQDSREKKMKLGTLKPTESASFTLIGVVAPGTDEEINVDKSIRVESITYKVI